jgi:hypothetical protein
MTACVQDVLLALSDQIDAILAKSHAREAELQELHQELATLAARQDTMEQEHNARVHEDASAVPQVGLQAWS